MTEFFLRSIELRDYNAKHLCIVLDVVDDNKLLVNVSPPMPAHLYKQSNDLEMLVLVPRYSGSSLTPSIAEWPCVVNICIPELQDWKNGPWRLLDIGEISKAGH